MIKHRQQFLVLAALLLTLSSVSPSDCFGSLLEEHQKLASDIFEMSEAVLWARQLPQAKPENVTSERTEFEILAIAKDTSKEFKVGQKVSIGQTWNPRPTSTFILYRLNSTLDDTYFWHGSGPVKPAVWDYVSQAPSTKQPPTERLPYYFKFLNSSEEYILGDALGEFKNAKFQDLVKIKDSMPRETLRKYLSNSNVGSYRHNFYGLLMGISGNESDAAYLFSSIEKSRSKSPTIFGELAANLSEMMVGYLLLEGEQGLDRIEGMISKSADVSFIYNYAILNAVTFLGKNSPEKIDTTRVHATMVKLLSQSEISDLVINAVSSMEDWSFVDEIVAMYDKEEYDIPIIKRAIIRYLWKCSHSWDKKVGSELPNYVTAANKALEKIEQSDPKIYHQAVRVFQLKQENQ